MNAFIDWLQFTFVPSADNDNITAKNIVEELLCLDFEKFGCCKGMYGYKSGYEYENIKVFYEGTETMGFHVQVTGKGCRYLENQEGFAWEKLFALLIGHNCNISRLDVALDDTEYLDMKKIQWYLERKLFTSRFKTWGIVEEKKLKDGEILGKTLYLGKRVSDVFIRIYDKKLESNGAIDAVRLETVLRNDKAKNFVVEYMKLENFGNLAFLANKVINNYIRFIKKNDENISRCSNAEWWEAFLLTCEKISLSKGKESVTLEKVCSWMERQCASALKLIIETKGEYYVRRMVDKAKLNDKHERLKAEYQRKVVNQ